MTTYGVIGSLIRPSVLLLLSGLPACTSSPMALAQRPDFDVTTSNGVASVSIREAPLGMPDAEFTRLVRAGMTSAGPGSVIAGPVALPFPSQRIVWHVNASSDPRGISKLVVNVFDKASPYAFEEESITNSAPTAVITSAIRSMSVRLLADIAAKANSQNASRDVAGAGGTELERDEQ